MRSVVRWLLACLLALALPIQAVAAFGMVHCLADGSHTAGQGVHSGQAHADHAHHNHGDLQPASGLSHAAHDVTLAWPNVMPVTDNGGEQPDGASAAAAHSGDTSALAHGGCSACVSCAACGAVAALPGVTSTWMAASVALHEPAASLPGSLSFLTDGPDRPPRLTLPRLTRPFGRSVAAPCR